MQRFKETGSAMKRLHPRTDKPRSTRSIEKANVEEEPQIMKPF